MADLTITVDSNAPTGRHGEYLLVLEFPISVAPDRQAYSLLDPEYACRFKLAEQTFHGSETMKALLEELLPPRKSGKSRRFAGLHHAAVYGNQVQFYFAKKVTRAQEDTAVRLVLRHYLPLTATPKPETVTLEFKLLQSRRTIQVGNL
jgi:hypothetical protein